MKRDVQRPKIAANREGFTLVELLVVMAILGVLISLLFPAFSQAKMKAMDLRCTGQLRRIGGAFMQMLGDRNFKLVTHAWNSNYEQNIWPMLLEDGGYFEERDALYCPVLPPDFDPYDDTKGGVLSWAHHVGYGLNMFERDYGHLRPMPHRGDRSDWVINYRAVPSPPDYLLLGESYLLGSGMSRYQISTPTASAVASPQARHRSSQVMNVFFLDGHVEACKEDRLNAVGIFGYFDADGNAL